jgi:hypothetical protein
MQYSLVSCSFCLYLLYLRKNDSELKHIKSKQGPDVIKIPNGFHFPAVCMSVYAVPFRPVL